ncbi:MAG: hypothetical protein HDS04_01740 [Bacteroides sp.]|nr:hypothetical protein [Bacteroides sp.]
MTTDHLLLGTIDDDGRVCPRPVVVTLLPDGTVASWHYLTGHEPHSTTPLRALLRLPAPSLHPLD